jgi:hypothetical protein
LKDLGTARLAQACLFSREGRHADATDAILGTVRLGQMAADGEGALLHYLVGAAVRSLGNQAAQRLAAESDVPVAELRRLLDGLPSLEDEPEVYARTIRVEFNAYALKPVDPVKLATDWTTSWDKNAEMLEPLIPEALHRAHRIFLTPSLVSGHPAPFDQAAAVRKTIARYERFLRNVRASWKAQEAEPENQEEITDCFLEQAESLLEVVAEEPLPLGRAAIERIRPAYNAFSNPVGRLTEAVPDIVDLSAGRAFQARVEREATRTLIALRIHRLQRGAWPARLDELVESGLLASLPQDAFSGAPLRYDRSRRILWSVGADEEDDNGESATEARWQQNDAVWPLEATTESTP